jgi:nucleotide-binding universal stress UspA family protein
MHHYPDRSNHITSIKAQTRNALELLKPALGRKVSQFLREIARLQKVDRDVTALTLGKGLIRLVRSRVRALHLSIPMDTRMRILIAYDGSDCAEAAIQDLERAGLPSKADALIISVAEPGFPPSSASSDEIFDSLYAKDSTAISGKIGERELDSLAEAQTMAAKAGERIQSSFPDWHVRAEAQTGKPSSQLLARANDWETDLIVVASHGRSAIGRRILGSVSHKIITEARCSVRIARTQNKKRNAPARIVVGVDGSPDSEEAVRAAAGRMWPAGSVVRIVAAFDSLTPTMAGSLIPPIVQWTEEQNQAALELVRRTVESFDEQFRKMSLSVSNIVKPGDAKRILVHESEVWKADCIFVGARGLSRIDRFLLGSVSTAVAGRAHCSVEVVRPGARPSAEASYE